jgi:hypothetical protein
MKLDVDGPGSLGYYINALKWRSLRIPSAILARPNYTGARWYPNAELLPDTAVYGVFSALGPHFELPSHFPRN